MSSGLVVFDLDGTLAESKSKVDEQTVLLLEKLLEKHRVAIISGGALTQFHHQLLSHLTPSNFKLVHLYLMPLSGSELYEYLENEWRLVHSSSLSAEEKTAIVDAIHKSLSEVSFALLPEHYGERIEDRGAQITFSALGQEAPLSVKLNWDPDKKKRLEFARALQKHLPDFEVHVGGSTSVDVTRKGINKASSLVALCERVGVNLKDVLYVGDDLFPDGNDYIVKSLGINTKQVSGPAETRDIIRQLLVY